MGVVMGVMAVLMVVGFLGFGHHQGMMGGHGKEGHEAAVEDKQIKNDPCRDCPGPGQDEMKNGADMKEGSDQDDKVH